MLLIEAIRHVADPIPLPSATHGTQFSRKHRNAEKLVPVPGIEPGRQAPGGSPLKTKADAVSASAKKKIRGAPTRLNSEFRDSPTFLSVLSPSSNYRLRWIVMSA